MKKKLQRNIIRCKHCNEIIESKSLYDYKRCGCGKVAVDGGLEYAKRSFPSFPAEDHLEDLSEYE
ncbi:hypothetical protein JOC86_000450 [Bacillus pakistanensis]|uniref:DUF7695 domain-containing protein n=1 Tax=Rossellomorea pakistanensis TaxID=992288 RepID=A0ABS2N7W1_9BACI|nr:hypothetical protein [Bacillus pakistanensis]